MSAGLRKDKSGNIVLDIEITNLSDTQITDFDIMFNKNPFGVAITGVANKVEFP